MAADRTDRLPRLTEQLVEAWVTVWLVVLLFKRALVELLQTERAHKVFWMELAEHGRDASSGNRLVASGAQRAAFRVIVGLAIRMSCVARTHKCQPVLITCQLLSPS